MSHQASPTLRLMRQKRLWIQVPVTFLMLLSFMVWSVQTAVAGNTWTGGGASTNWSDANNWGGAAPVYGTLTFTTGGTQGTTSVLDANTNMNQLLWTGSSNWILNNSGGAVLSLFDNGGVQAKLENQSTGLVTINAPVTFAATAGANWGEINAVNGNMTFGSAGTLTVNGTGVNGIRMFGSGRTTTFNNTVSAAGKYFATIGTGTNMAIGGTFTAGGIYVMNNGSLNINTGASITAPIYLGGDYSTNLNATTLANLTQGGTVNLTPTAGGLTLASAIGAASAGGVNTSGALTISSQNTSGTNTISGQVFLDSNLNIRTASGGTLALTSGGTQGVDLKSQTLTFQGEGTVTSSAIIGNSTGAGTVTKTGSGTLDLQAANTFSGALNVGGGLVRLAGSGTAANTSGVNFSNRGTLTLDNSVTNNGNRTAGAITSGGGTINFLGNSAATTETLGALTLNAGALTINNTSGGGGNTLTIPSLARNAGGTLYINNSTGSSVVLSTAPALVNSILRYAVVTNGAGLTSFANYPTTSGTNQTVVPLATASHVAAEASWVAASNGRPTASAALAGSRSVYTVTLDSGIDIQTPTADRTLTIGGGVLQTGGTSVIDGSTTFDNILAFGSNEALFYTVGTLQLNRGNTNTLTGTGGFTKSGAGTLILNGVSTLTGAFNVNEGTLEMRGATSLMTTAATINLNGGTLRLFNDTATTYTGNPLVNADTSIIVSRATAAATATTHTIGTLSIGSGRTLSVSSNNINSGTAYGLTAGVLTLTSGGATIDVANNGAGTGTMTVAAPTGAFQITKTNAGDLVTNSTTTGFTGPVEIQAGRVGWSGTSGIITEGQIFSGTGGIIRNGANGTTNLTGANTFTGEVRVTAGTLGYSTVGNNGSTTATNLGQGTDGLTLSGGTLSFIGSTSQSTNRGITLTASSNLGANGTSGATMTYAGAIAAGTANPTFNGTGNAFITGGISQTNATADWAFSPTGTGTLTVSGNPWAIGDDFTLTGVGAASVLNLNTTGVYATNGQSNTDAAILIRNGTLSFGADNPIVPSATVGVNRITLADGTTTGTGTLNLNGFKQSIPRIDLGAVATSFDGVINGGANTNLLTVTTTININRGTIASDVIMAGAGAITKAGLGTVTISSENSGLTGTAVRLDAGNTILDYTTNNTNKVSSASVLDMRGSTLTLNGNASGATTQSVASFTLANGGNNKIDVNNGSGQSITFNLGAITRAAGAGTIRFELPTSGNITTTTANAFGAGANGILGGYSTVTDASGNTFFARNDGSNNIVASSVTSQDVVTSWVNGDNVTDSTGFTGFTGSLTSANLNSLRFNANAASSVSQVSGGVLGVASGGILMTSAAVTGTRAITGGRLASGISELVFTQDSAQTLAVSSVVSGNNAITKTGTGTLSLTGTGNNYTGATQIQAGTVITNGTGIGDTSAVTLADDQVTTLQLTGNETIGSINGGNNASGLTVGTVDIGLNTLTLANGSNFVGVFTGSGSIIKNGTANLNLTGVSAAGYTGTVVVNNGLFQLSANGSMNPTSITLNKGGAFLLDKNGTTRTSTAIPDTTGISLNSADGVSSGSTIVRGLWIRTDQAAATNETVGIVALNSGANYVTADGTATGAITALIADNVTRSNNSTLNVRGSAMSATANSRGQFRIGTAGNQTAFVGTLVGGGGALGTRTISIVPYAIAQEVATATSVNDTTMGNSLAGYVSGQGFRALDLTNEYNTYAASAVATENIRETGTAGLTGLTGKTINAIVLDNANVAAGSVTYAGTGTGGQTLGVTSGAMLFTLNSGAAAGNYSTTLSGFDGGITTAGANPEYVIHVVNPNSASATTVLSTTISSSLTSTADITKSGRGTLILSAANTAGGGTKKTTINEGTLQIDALNKIGGGTGGLVFASGTLLLGTGFTDDLSTRTISFLPGGGTIDTNGINIALANSLGSGSGTFTKAGAGNLTLNAAATLTGGTNVTAGTLTMGASQAIGTGALAVSGATTVLAMGANNATVSGLSTATAGVSITGTGTLTVNGDASLSAGTVNPTLAGSMNLIAPANATIVLGGAANSFTGFTQIQQGTVSVLNLANAGSNSGLGAPTGANAPIRIGSTTTGGTLLIAATGTGGATDRPIWMSGTTGGAVIDNDGTGALTINADVRAVEYGAKTLTLQGTPATFTNVLNGNIDTTLGTINFTKAEAGTWQLNGTNNSAGTATLTLGTLILNNNANGGLPTGNLTLTAGTLQALNSAKTLSNNASIGGSVTVSGAQSLTLNGTFTNSGGNRVLTSSITGGNTLTLAGFVYLSESASSARTLTIAGTGNTTVSGGIADFNGSGLAGNLTITNSGTTFLSGTNTYSGNTTLTGGATLTSATVRIGSGSAFPDGAGRGNVTINPVSGASLMLDLNGSSEAINGLTATTAGSNVTIDNTSASPASLTFGGNDQNVAIGASTGNFAISNTGGGALSLTKTGTGTATISDTSLSYTGTTNVNGGSLTISSPVNGTTALNVSNGTLSLSGGITTPTAITSVSVGNGSTLNLLDGAGNKLTSLTSLTLGSALGTNTTLGLNVGDVTAGDNLNTDRLGLASGSLNLFAGNNITFNLTDTGLNPNTDYILLDATAISGGFTSGPLTLANYILGATPGGFTGMDLTTSSTNNQIILRTGNLITGASYFTGITNNAWNAGANNWSTDKAGTIVAGSIPGQGTDVVFRADNAVTSTLTTTLEQNFKVNSLTFEASTTPANTPASITIAPGTITTSRLEIAPQVATDGIKILSGGTPAVTISAPLRLGRAQTWNVADSASVLTLSGGLTGEADVTKTGPGKVIISTAAASTFNTGLTTDVTVSGGILELTNAGGLGTVGDTNGANVAIATGGTFYHNNATATTTGAPVPINLTFSGGTLSAGGNNQFYGTTTGSITATAATTTAINLRDQNSATLTTTQRNITLQGAISGSGGITLDSINTASSGNQLTGTLTLSGANSGWSGGIGFNRGSISATNVSALGTGPITATLGRITFATAGGTTFAIPSTQTLTVDGVGSVFEFTADASGTPTSDMTINYGGAITLGSVANANVGLRLFQATDNFSVINIKGGIVLANNASISTTGSTTRTVTIDTVGISETGGSRVLSINDDVGGWGQTNQRLAINVASSYTGGTNLAEGTLILGHKDAIGTGTLTITGASTLQASVDLSSSGSGPVPNALTLNNSLTVSGSNNLTINGITNATGADASRTLTNNLTAGSLVLAGTVNLGATGTTAARTLTITGTGNTEISGAIINNTAFAHVLTKTGTGTLTLSNSAGNVGGTTGNTFTGGININQGTVRATASNVLPNTGTITVNATTAGTALLDLNGNSDTIAALTLGGTGGLVTSVNQVSTGAGTLTLGGNVTVTNTGNWTTPASISGNLSVGAVSRTFTVGDSSGTVIDLQVDALVSSVGAFGIVKAGAGTMLLTNTGNSYSGGTTINTGEVRTGASNVLPNSGTITLLNTTGAAAVLNLNGNSDTIAALAFGGTGGVAASVNQVITGAGTLTLGGNVSTSSTGNPTATPIITGNLALGAATRTFTVADSTGSAVDLDVQAIISGTGVGITKAGAGVLVLSNVNTYTGATTISPTAGASFGVIRATANDALGTGAVTSVFASGATTGQIQLSGGITLSNSSFTTSGVGSDGTTNGVIRSVSGANIISGAINMTGGGGASTYRADTGSTLTFNGNVGGVGTSPSRIVNLVGGGDFVFNGIIRNANDATASTVGVNSSNTGMTTLNGVNTYTLATTVGTGSTLIAGSIQAFGVGSATTVDGTLRLAGFSNSIGSLTGAGTVENASATAATLSSSAFSGFTGLIQDGTGAGSLSITKTSAGTSTLAGTNTFSGKTTIANGTLSVATVDPTATAAQPLGTNSDLDLGVAATSSGRFLYTGGAASFGKNINALGNGTDTIENGGSGLLTLTGTITKAGTTLTLNGGSSGLYVGGLIVGAPAASDLIIAGGTVTLANANTYNGPTFLNAGTLNINNASAISTGVFNINGGTIDNTSGSAITLTTNNPLNITSNFTFTGTNSLNLGTGAVTLDANRTVTVTANTLTIGGAISGAFNLTGTGAGTLVLSGASTYTGTTTALTGTTISVGGNGSLGDTSSGTVVDSGASLALNNVLYTDAEALTINGTGVGGGGALQTTGTSSFAGSITAATHATINATGTLGLTGGLVKDGTTLTLGGTGTYNITGTGISGASANSDLIVDAATVNLNVANTYNGPTFIRNGGVINANVTNALPTSIARTDLIMDDSGSGSSNLTLGVSQSIASLTGAASSTVALGSNTLTIGKSSGTTTFAGVISGAGNIEKEGASIQVLSGTNTFTGTTTINAGTLRISDEANLGANPSSSNSAQLTLNGGTLNTTATMAINDSNRGVTLGAGGGTFETADSTTLNLNNVITGPGALNKMGGGTLGLDNANTYTGETNVNAGILNVTNTSGSATGSGTVTVGTSGTLAGTGKVEAAANNYIYINGTLQVGDSTLSVATASTLEVKTSGTGSMVLGSSSIVKFDLFTGAGMGDSTAISSAADQIRLFGSLDAATNLGSTLLLTYQGAGSFVAGDMWKLFDLTGPGTISGAFNINYSGLGLGPLLAAELNNSTGILSIVTVPEPSRALLYLIGLMGIFLRRRRC